MTDAPYQARLTVLNKHPRIPYDISTSKDTSYAKQLEAYLDDCQMTLELNEDFEENQESKDFYSIIRSIEDRLQRYGSLNEDTIVRELSYLYPDENIIGLKQEFQEDSSESEESADDGIFKGASKQGFFNWDPRTKPQQEACRFISEEVDSLLLTLAQMFQDHEGSGFPKGSEVLFARLGRMLECDPTLDSEQVYRFLTSYSSRKSNHLKAHIGELTLLSRIKDLRDRLAKIKDSLLQSFTGRIRKRELSTLDQTLESYSATLIELSRLKRQLIEKFDSEERYIDYEGEVRVLVNEIKEVLSIM
mmetsp:Transcript_23880/g.42269  ORF Transcript_23880/g.42269 Transcript_23880/m.42269 type:complete len:304 (+) Transcript_23880:835-1746(+)